jgi:L-ascorbate 6-phosphate lactonase
MVGRCLCADDLFSTGMTGVLRKGASTMGLAQRICDLQVEPGSLAIFWLAQAGFVFKTPTGKIIYIDPYLTDSVHRQLGHIQYGFKRQVLAPMLPEEVDADLVACTHAHEDHFDVDLMPILARNPRTQFASAPDCRTKFDEAGIPASRYTILQRGETFDGGDFRLTSVFADHGELAPDASGMLLEVGDIRIWQVGDTAYRPDRWQDIFAQGVDVILAPINGAYGNLNPAEAARLAHDAHAKVAIPCHYWMFAEHGGDPAGFLEACKELAPETQAVLMSPGELFLYTK